MNDKQIVNLYEKFRSLSYRYQHIKTQLNKIRAKLGLRQLRDCPPAMDKSTTKEKATVKEKQTETAQKPTIKPISQAPLEVDKITIFYLK